MKLCYSFFIYEKNLLFITSFWILLFFLCFEIETNELRCFKPNLLFSITVFYYDKKFKLSYFCQFKITVSDGNT